jgi:hypothetical protein
MSDRPALDASTEEHSDLPDIDYKRATTPERRVSSAPLLPTPVSMPWPKKPSTSSTWITKPLRSRPASVTSDRADPKADRRLPDETPRDRWRRAIKTAVEIRAFSKKARSWSPAFESLQQVAEEIVQRGRKRPLRINRWLCAIRLVMRRNLARKRNLAMKRWRDIVRIVLELSTIRRTDGQTLGSSRSGPCDTLARTSGQDSSFENCSCQAFSLNKNLVSLCACGHLEKFHGSRRGLTVDRANSSQRDVRHRDEQIPDEIEDWTADQLALWVESGREAHLQEEHEARLRRQRRIAEREELRRLSHFDRYYSDDEDTGFNTNMGDNVHLESHGNMKDVQDPQQINRVRKRRARDDSVSTTESKRESDSSVTQSTKRLKAADAENSVDATKDTWVYDRKTGSSRTSTPAKGRMERLSNKNADLKNEVVDLKYQGYDSKRQRKAWEANTTHDATIVNALPLVGFTKDGPAETSKSLGDVEKTLDQKGAQNHPKTALPTVPADDPSTGTRASRILDISEISLQSAHTFPTEDVVAYIHQLQRQVEEKDKLLEATDHVNEHLQKKLRYESGDMARSVSGGAVDSALDVSHYLSPLEKYLQTQNLEPKDVVETSRNVRGTTTPAKSKAEDVGVTDTTYDGGTQDRAEDSSDSGEENGSTIDIPEAHTLPKLDHALKADWNLVQAGLPNDWMWDVEYQSGCWICTPLEPDNPKHYPLTIAGAPVVLPVEYQWPPIGGVNPPPDPRPSAPIDPWNEPSLDTVRDLFLTFEGSVGFYVLISGLLQIIVSEDFDTAWASSHLPHKYGGLRVCYIPQTLEPTVLPSSTEITRADPIPGSQNAGLSGLFKWPRTYTGPPISTLKLNDFIEVRPKANHRNEKFSGRIGLQVTKLSEPFLILSTHIITEAILARSHRDALMGRSRARFEKLDHDWNEHVDIWAGNEKIGTIEKSFDQEAEIYPIGFRHDVTLVKPTTAASVSNIVSPIRDLGWLDRASWCALRQQTFAVKILGPTNANRAAKSIQCSRPSEISIVGEGIFLNQIATPQNSKSLKDHDVSTWKNMVSRALLYRVHPDFDPPNGHSGTALYAEGTRIDGTTGPGVVGFQSFVQRSGHVQNFRMEGTHLERRLNFGRVAFYGAFEVPVELKQEYTIV